MAQVVDPSNPVPVSLPLDRRSSSWRVLAEPVVFFGGGRALLLQVAHPSVAAGVEQHSTYATDPWARLFRTVDVMTKLSFGPSPVSDRQVVLLDRLHRGVVGTTSHGETYDARDPALLVWVWATLVDTALRCYELVFTPLTPATRDRYYEEAKLVAHACGVPPGGCPTSWEDFQAYMAGMVEDELRVTPEALRVAHATMVPPLPSPLRSVVAPFHQLVTAGLLPEPVRTQFGLSWDEQRQRSLDRFFAVAGVAMRATPRPVRELPTRRTLEREAPLHLGWLQRHGARLTQRRMVELERREG